MTFVVMSTVRRSHRSTYTPASADVLRYEATIEDPKVFTRPWKMSFPLYRRRDKNAQFMEFKCMPFVEDLLYDHLRKK